MDEADYGNEAAERFLEDAFAYQLAIAENKLPPIGHCYNCAKPLPPEMSYCDRDCQIDHERRKAAYQRNKI